MAAGAVSAMEANFYGGWRVSKVEIHVKEANNAANTSGLEGVEFSMSDSGDLTWKVPRNYETMPYFVTSFDLYEVQGSKIPTVKFFGGRSGETIELSASLKRGDKLVLQYEHSFSLFCEKVLIIDRAVEEPFCFLNALREGYFSDLVIKADTGKKFQVHRTILQASCPQMNWAQNPPPLSNIPEDTLSTILHFLYSECLPDDMSEDKAKQCIKMAGKLPGLDKLMEQCETFVQNIAVKNQIITLINDMHGCADRIIDIFSGNLSSSSSSSDVSSMSGNLTKEENLLAEPAKFCYACKQAAREAAVASVKFLTICDLFARRRSELSRAERHEIIKYAKSRLPVFVKQMNRFLEVLREQHSKRMSATQRQELAMYLVPEIDSSMEILTKVIQESKHALEEVLRATSAAGKEKKHSTGDYLHKTVKQAMHLKELMKLKTLHDKASEFFASLQWKKQSFELLSHDEKIYSIVKNMEQMLEEFPHMLRKIEKLDMRVNDGLSMKNWKFVFKMGTSRVAWALEKAYGHKPSLQPVLQRLCALVHRESFNSSLLQLGLLDASSQYAAEMGGEGSVYNKMFARTSTTARPMYQPQVLESLSIPPSPSESKIAKVMSELLITGKDSDMCFEIVSVKDEPSDIVVDHTQGKPVARQEDTTMEEISLIKAHRAVIASRCDWFRRALLSGMRESIDRKIEVHDADPNLFRQFLSYLYSGSLETSAMTVEQLADMMSLSDRYEVDNLKQVCEAALKMRLDEDSVLFLLSLADQFHATILREAALNFIMEHPAVTQSDVYEELPAHLKSEVSNLVTWNKEEPMVEGERHFKGMQYDSDSDDSSDYGIEVKDLAKGLADARNESKVLYDSWE